MPCYIYLGIKYFVAPSEFYSVGKGAKMAFLTLKVADDIALLSQNHKQMQEKLREVEQKAAETGLHISIQKTKVLKANTKTLASLMVNHQPLEDVNSFIFHGSEVASDGGSEGDVKRRIGKARDAFGMMGAIWRARNITLKTKI